MTPFDIAMNRQRAIIQQLNSDALRLKLAIIQAASHAHRGNADAALKLITDHAERINDEIERDFTEFD